MLAPRVPDEDRDAQLEKLRSLPSPIGYSFWTQCTRHLERTSKAAREIKCDKMEGADRDVERGG